MRFPGLGALGCMSAEGFSFRELKQAPHVTSAVPAREMPKTAIAKIQLNPNERRGSWYSVPYARQKMEEEGRTRQNSRNAADERGEASSRSDIY